MKNSITTLLFILITHQFPAAQNVTLVTANSSSSTPEFQAADMALDGNGNKIIVGPLQHRGTHDFDPSANIVQLDAPSASTTGFVASYSTTGALNFAFHISDEDIQPSVILYLVETDAQNNLYILGRLAGKADLDPGPGKFEIMASTVFDGRSFIASYTPTGAFRFAIELPLLGNVEEVNIYSNNGINKVLSVDALGNSYLLMRPFSTGNYDLDPGPNTYLVQFGKHVVSYDAQGQFRFGYPAPQNTKDIGCNAAGNHYIMGLLNESLDDTFDFDPGPNTVYLNSTNNNAFFLAGYNPNGSFRFVNDIKGPNVIPLMVAAADNGDVYVLGKMAGVLDFDPGNGQFEVTVSTFEIDDSGDFFMARYDVNGGLKMAQALEDKVGQVSTETITDAEVDRAGNLHIVGNLQLGQVDFDPSPATLLLSGGVTGKDMFVATYQPNGAMIAAHTIQNSGISYNSLELDAICPLYTLCGTVGENIQLDLDPGPGTANVISPSGTGNVVTMYLVTLQANGIMVPNDCTLLDAGVSNTLETNIKVFPNPCVDLLQIDLGETSKTTFLQIFNAIGQQVHEATIKGSNYLFDCSGLSSGVYHLKLYRDKSSVARNFVVQHP